jgi:hypothetical protein
LLNAPRRSEPFFAIHGEMAPLQPAHQDEGKACRAPIRIASVRALMSAARHVGRIGLREQPLECLKTNGIECVDHHFSQYKVMQIR